MNIILPRWLRVIVLISALMQLGFGLTLLIEPSRVADIWPWTLPPLTARILGASTLVSVPLALLSIGINRYSVAAIPFMMLATYRVMQLLAGAFHTGRFGGNLWLTINYFGGGFLMLVVLGCALWAGQNARLPRSVSTGWLSARKPWALPLIARLAFAALGIFYIALGIVFFVKSSSAAQFWIDARGITPLTAKLFSSPLIGLGLGLVLVSRASEWRMVAVPATGFMTIGVTVVVALVLGRADFAPASWIGWLVAATPVMLFAAGAAIFASKPENALRPQTASALR